MKRTIFHIARNQDWLAATKQGEYRISSLATEGFIHCSDLNQVARVANYHFKGQQGLILLEINTNEIKAEIKYEGETEEKFPHIYGPIDLESVVKTHEFESAQNGIFEIPSTVRP